MKGNAPFHTFCPGGTGRFSFTNNKSLTIEIQECLFNVPKQPVSECKTYRFAV